MNGTCRSTPLITSNHKGALNEPLKNCVSLCIPPTIKHIPIAEKKKELTQPVKNPMNINSKILIYRYYTIQV